MNYSYDKNGFVRVQDPYDRSGYVHGIAVLLEHPNARLPKRANPTDAGADLTSIGDYTIKPGESMLIDTGVSIKIPVGYAGILMCRSSQRVKGITSLGDGLIDSDYRGTLRVFLMNLGKKDYEIYVGDKIGQLVIKKVEIAEYVDIWNDTERGTGGFGSTGK